LSGWKKYGTINCRFIYIKMIGMIMMELNETYEIVQQKMELVD
jgi:hypothetical protein